MFDGENAAYDAIMGGKVSLINHLYNLSGAHYSFVIID